MRSCLHTITAFLGAVFIITLIPVLFLREYMPKGETWQIWFMVITGSLILFMVMVVFKPWKRRPSLRKRPKLKFEPLIELCELLGVLDEKARHALELARDNPSEARKRLSKEYRSIWHSPNEWMPDAIRGNLFEAAGVSLSVDWRDEPEETWLALPEQIRLLVSNDESRITVETNSEMFVYQLGKSLQKHGIEMINGDCGSDTFELIFVEKDKAQKVVDLGNRIGISRYEIFDYPPAP